MPSPPSPRWRCPSTSSTSTPTGSSPRASSTSRGAPEYAGLLFHDVRFDEDGRERADFVLNQPAFRAARILVANDNFGCGSSREHAVWALAAYGIRAVIAPSFGDIFFNNCFKVGVLPVVVPAGDRRGPAPAAARHAGGDGDGGPRAPDRHRAGRHRDPASRSTRSAGRASCAARTRSRSPSSTPPPSRSSSGGASRRSPG